MRCFIAIDIGEEVRRRLELLTAGLRKPGADVRWVRPGSIHLTLKFLGEIDDGRAEKIKEVLSSITEGYERLSIEVKGTGAFPRHSRPRVLWVGLEAPDRLNLLFKDIEKSLEVLGFEKEKRAFSPHLTIGRVKSQQGIRPILSELRKDEETVFGSIDVESIDLMKSTLRPSGAMYERLFSAKLK